MFSILFVIHIHEHFGNLWNNFSNLRHEFSRKPLIGGHGFQRDILRSSLCVQRACRMIWFFTDSDGAVAMSSANRLVGTGFASRDRLQTAGF